MLTSSVIKVLAVSCLLIISACSSSPRYSTDYLHIKPGTVTVIDINTTAVIEIHNEFGIGRTSVTLLDGTWRTPTVVRLYLKGLEGFEVTNNLTTLDKYQLDVTQGIIDGANYYDVNLPSDFLTNSKTITLSWVDFYRQ